MPAFAAWRLRNPDFSAGHAQGGAQTDPELTFRPDHPMGADHVLEGCLGEIGVYAGGKLCDSPKPH
ncbi:hypothetical protein LGH83_18170 [Lichenihabitans sp. PAMC28606]|nr:hypothetical protein [Lichenihabitans sp. PAMC28606]UDL94409.1 hypothetical protein LGH83_18170 [Lichenihabitans sp. PAMC28606]